MTGRRSGIGIAGLIMVVVMLTACGGDPQSDGAASSEGTQPDTPSIASGADADKSTTDPETPTADLVAPQPMTDGQHEIWGRVDGERFWLRLKARNDELGQRRILMLQYPPPDKEALGGTVLADCPWLLVNDYLLIHAWNERGGTLSSAVYDANARAYEIICERERPSGDDVVPYEETRTIAGNPAWDRRLAPLLLALFWQQGTAVRIPLVDLFGPHPDQRGRLEWRGEMVQIDDAVYDVEADADGRLRTVRDETGSIVVAVEGRAPYRDAAAAAARDREAARRLEERQRRADAERQRELKASQQSP